MKWSRWTLAVSQWHDNASTINIVVIIISVIGDRVYPPMVASFTSLYLTPPTLLEILALSLTNILSSLTKARYYHIRQLRCVQPYLDSSTACTIATSIVHSKLDYCNYLYYELPKSQLSSLQQIFRTLLFVLSLQLLSPVISLPPYALSTGLESLNALKVLSLTYKVLTTTQPPYLHLCLTSSLHSLFIRPYFCSTTDIMFSKITYRSFRYVLPCLWNQLPVFCTSSSISDSPITSPITSSSFDSPLCSS